MTDTTTPDRAFVLGLDGVPWNKLAGWIDAGELPNFARLRKEAAAGPLESTMPPTTSLAWPSIATGVRPDNHGIYWFRALTEDYSHELATSRDVEAPRLWDMLSPAVVANVPVTYPAEPMDGELVTGMMTPAMNEGFTHPSALGTEIENRVPEYEIGLTWTEYTDDQEAFLDDFERLVAARRKLMELLMEREDWRLFFFVYTAPDRLQHLFWDDDVLLDHYTTLDDVLGDVMTYVDDVGANLFVVSDHGFGPISKYVAVNTVLEREGFLARRTDSGTRTLLSQLGFTKDSLTSLLDSVGLDVDRQERLVRALPRSIVDRVRSQVPGSHVLYDVDFANTLAFVYGPGLVYVNDVARFDRGVVDPDAVPALKAELEATFTNVVDPETGERILRVFDGDDLFPTDDRSPDLVVRAVDGYKRSTTLQSRIVYETAASEASHRLNGIFFARGPSIDESATPTDASVVDVAPTVLHSVGEPVPTNLDGESISGVVTGPSLETREPGETRAAGEGPPDRSEDFEDVQERLRGLGYVD